MMSNKQTLQQMKRERESNRDPTIPDSLVYAISGVVVFFFVLSLLYMAYVMISEGKSVGSGVK